MTFISTIKKSASPNCVRTFSHQHEQTTDDKAQPTGGSNDTMDELTRQLASVCPTNLESCGDDSVVQKRDKPPPISIFMARNVVFHLLIHMGSLSSLFVDVNRISDKHDAIGILMGQMIALLTDLSYNLSINLHDACMKKIQLNQRKYPVELCKGKAGKYTEYSQQTGITKTVGQSTLDETNNNSPSEDSVVNNVVCWTETFVPQSVLHIQQKTRQFAIDRDWLQFHTPRNLALALAGEIGELAEIFQFLGDNDTNNATTILSSQQMDKVGQELADVTIYICRLSDVCHVPIRNETLKE